MMKAVATSESSVDQGVQDFGKPAVINAGIDSVLSDTSGILRTLGL